ncbi:MAG TPA: LytTR family DNA-binding domain-containing protein [Bacteroidia bacterium]|nr:LytTR family DNA-binding domain-containing protein [Bacteroidia bacterium]
MKGNIVISDNKKIHAIVCSDILRLESQGGYTIIHSKNNQQYVSSNHLKIIIKDLDPRIFFRVHKSHVVNLKEVKTYEKGTGGLITMSDGSIVVVSRRNKTEFLKKFCSK